MENLSPQSHLQIRILVRLASNPVSSITKLADDLRTHRSSVSRAMHLLQSSGFVDKDNKIWSLTEKGSNEENRIRGKYSDQMVKASSSAVKIMEQVQGSSLLLNSSLSKYLDEFNVASRMATLAPINDLGEPLLKFASVLAMTDFPDFREWARITDEQMIGTLHSVVDQNANSLLPFSSMDRITDYLRETTKVTEFDTHLLDLVKATSVVPSMAELFAREMPAFDLSEISNSASAIMDKLVQEFDIICFFKPALVFNSR